MAANEYGDPRLSASGWFDPLAAIGGWYSTGWSDSPSPDATITADPVLAITAVPAPSVAANISIDFRSVPATVTWVSPTRYGTSNVSGTSVALSPGMTADVGDLLIVAVSVKPASATTPTVTAADSQGNTYTQVGANFRAASGAGSGVVLYTFICKVTHALSSAAITATLSDAVIAKVITVDRFTGADATISAAVTSDGSVQFGSVYESQVSNSVPSGDLVFGVASWNYGTGMTPTWDSDTLNGSWASGYTQAIGSGYDGASVFRQFKIVTADGAQTWNMSVDQVTFRSWTVFGIAASISSPGTKVAAIASIPLPTITGTDPDATVSATLVSAVTAVQLPTTVGDPNAFIDLRGSPAAISYVGASHFDLDNSFGGGDWSTSITLPGSTGDLVVSQSTHMGGTQVGTTPMYWMVNPGTAIPITVTDGEDWSFDAWAYHNVTASSMVDDYVSTTDFSAPYEVPSLTATNSNDMEVAWFGSTTPDSQANWTHATLYHFYRLLSASGATGAVAITNATSGSIDALLLKNAGGDGSPDGLNIKVIATASVPAPTVSANSTITSSTPVAAVSAVRDARPALAATTVSAVSAIVRPAFNVAITTTSVATVTAIALPQSPATVTASAVLATTAVTDARPAINVIAVTAVTTISQPQSPATITATAVPAVSVVIRPAFHVSITGLTATAATTTLTGYAASAGSTVTATLMFTAAATPAATVHLYKMGAYKPNVLYTLTNLTGAYTDIDDSPDTPDANALVPTGGAIVVRMGFEDHSQAMRTEAGDQKFRVVVKVP